MKILWGISVVIASLFIFVGSAHAVEFKSGELVTIEKNQIVNGSLFVSGSSIVIDGIVRGDLYCAGRSIIVKGTVDGDVLCAGQTLRLEGRVGGDVRMAGQMISISAVVGKNVNVLSQSLTVEPTTNVNGELIFAAQTATIAGVIHGDITYTSDKELAIDQTATVSGAISYYKANPKEKQAPKDKKSWPQNSLPSVFFYTLLGIIIVAMFPRAVGRIQKNMQEHGLVSGAIGLTAIVGAPLLLLFLLVSIVGIVAIPFFVCVYFVAIGVGRIVAATLLGRGILDGFTVKSKDNLFLQVVVGVPILWIMFNSPFVGGLLVLLSVIWGLGGVILSLHKTKK